MPERLPHSTTFKSHHLFFSDMDCIIVRYAEIALKGRNRIHFERRLVSNIEDCLKKNSHPFQAVERLRNRILVRTEQDCPHLRRVFGIASYSPATQADLTMEAMSQQVLAEARQLTEKSAFRISCQRVDKAFKHTSSEIQRSMGALVQQKTRAKVSLTAFDTDIGIELFAGRAFVFTKRVSCFGGMPLGTEGKAVVVISDKAGIVASLLLMKRGVEVLPVAAQPMDIGLMERYSYGCQVELKLLSGWQEIETYAHEKRTDAIAVSQTLERFEQIPVGMLLLRPLIGYDSKEIDELYERFRQA